MEDHVASILAVEVSVAAASGDLPEDVEVEMSCVMNASGVPPLSLPMELIQGMGVRGMSLDIDLYIDVD